MIKNRRCILFLGFTSLLLSSCGVRDGLAPVEEVRTQITNQSSATRHTVQKGETLYAIAFRYDQDYHVLARINHLNAPYALRIGQVIKLNARAQPAIRPMLPDLPLFTSNSQWLWPAKGRIKTTFFPNKGRKGIDIAGKRGQNIRASAAGVVAYAGNGLPGYGNLIILKHDKQYLTAYGNNQKNLVHEGQTIKKGAVIAKMGMIDRAFWGLHFEIRKQGEPINPLSYLPKKT